MIKGIIFDMDGTLVDSIPIHFKIWNSIGRKYGFDLNRELFDELNGMKTHKICDFLVKRFKLDIDTDEMADEKQRISGKELEKSVPLFKGVKKTLLLLKRLGYRLSVGTSTTREHAVATLGPVLTEIEFDSVVTGYEVDKSKPEPDLFLKCAEQMGVLPNECMVIEDSINGITAAKRGGMTAVAITNTTSADKFAKADAIISKISEINSEFIQKLACL